MLTMDPKNAEGLPPLWYALKDYEQGEPFVSMALGLVEKGSTLNMVCDENNNTLLHLCASDGLEKAAQFAIANGASCDVINASGETALHSAARGGLDRVARTLLDKGADPNVQSFAVQSSSRQTPMHIAVQNQNLSFVQTMLESNMERVPVNLHLKDSEGKTAFALSLELRNHDVASELLKGGANVNDSDINNRTLLHLSVSDSDLETTRFLLEAGCDLNVK